jgi:hypothetical protein
MEVVRLVDRVGVDSIIRDELFEDTLFLGPAVIALLDRVTMQNCSFDGDPISLFIELPGERRVVGVVGLIGTTFRRCRFQNIGIIGTAEAIERMRNELIAGTDAAAEQAANHEAAPAESVPESPGREAG